MSFAETHGYEGHVQGEQLVNLDAAARAKLRFGACDILALYDGKGDDAGGDWGND
jgi:hypothetical protein